MVASGSQLTFTVTGNAGGYVPVTANDVRSDVISRLSAYFTIYVVTINPPPLSQIWNPSEWLHWSYTAVVTIKTRGDYGSVDDIASVIANAFYQAAGALPTVRTGTILEPGVNHGPGPIDTVLDALTGVGNAATGILAGPTLVAVLVIGGLALLIAYGPNLKGVGGKISLS